MMRYSQSFSRTLRDAPGNPEGKGLRTLLKGGYIKQLGAGIFSMLPFGLIVQRKIEAILRKEMNGIGGQEVLLPLVNPADIWKTTGRYYSIGSEMTRLSDRRESQLVLAMTHEEAVTDLATLEIDSHKKLPRLVYQIQTKWRDDPRPRAGLIRVREFTMKDSYSFDKSVEGMQKQYQAHYDAYFRFFDQVGLPVKAVSSDSGMMGGKVAHEYMYLSPLGEDTLIYCPKCASIANRQVAKFDKSGDCGKKEKPLELKKVATPGAKTIDELCSFLKIKKSQTAKALMMVGTRLSADGKSTESFFILGIVRGDFEIEENKLQNAAGALEMRPAQEEEIIACGLVPGFASPIGIKGVKEGKTVVIVDDTVENGVNLVCGANESGFHFVNSNFGRDYTGKVADIAQAREGLKCPYCGDPLKESRGIEVGNIFQLGTKYSKAFNLTFQDQNGERKEVIMGCYGIGVGRTLACVAEEWTDPETGAIHWPIRIAPYQVEIVNLTKSEDECLKIAKQLEEAGIDVMFDDRNETAGVKFADADLLGSPIRITVGNRTLKEGKAELLDYINYHPGEAAPSADLVPLRDVATLVVNKIKSAIEKGAK